MGDQVVADSERLFEVIVYGPYDDKEAGHGLSIGRFSDTAEAESAGIQWRANELASHPGALPSDYEWEVLYV